MEETVRTIWNFGDTYFTNGLLVFVIRSIIILSIAKLIVSAFNKALKKMIQKNEEQRMPLHFAGRILRFLLYLAAVMIILATIKPLSGISKAALGATSVISVVLGLAAQETFGNFISGFFLAMYHPFNVGDQVLLSEKGISGKVMEITFRHTVLLTPSQTKLIIPNSVMNTAIIENRNFGQSMYTSRTSLDIAYESDLNLAIQYIQKAIEQTEGIIDTRTDQTQPIVEVRVEEFAASGITLSFPITTEDMISNLHVSSEVRKKILQMFNEYDIEIPYQKVKILTTK